MAQTGTTFTLQSSSYQGRYLKLTCTSSQDIANNKTNISWKLESIGGSSGHYATIVRVNINGSEVYSIDKGYSYDAFPVTKGSTTGSTSVTMGSDGNKSITIYMDAAIYTSSTTRYSDTWTLNTVPRYPTISSFSVNKISGSSTSLSFVWSASAPGGNISKLEYSTDNGSTFKTASSVTSPLTVSGLASAQGYNCKIRVTSSASGLTATTQTPVYQTTYQQPTANISTANISGYNGLSQIKVSWSSNMDIAKVEYSKDNGSTWYNAGDPNASSGNYTYTGLTEGQWYNFKVRVTATTGSCITTSGTSSLSTYKRVSGNLYVNNVKVGTSNGQTGIALKNGDTLAIKDISNQGQGQTGCGYKLFFENPDNQHQYLSAKQTGLTEVSMTAEQIRQRLQYMTTVNSQGFNVGITTLNGSDQPALYYEFFGTLKVENSNPTFTLNNWTYQDTNSTTVALTGSNQILVNGFSKLRVNIGTAAGGVNYATISQYAVSGCTSGSSTTTGNIDCATATNGGTITVAARDSRGNTTSTSRTATFKNYAIPTMASISATRSNGGVGTQTTLTFNGTWWNANFGASNNTIAASYRYKSGSTWSTARAITLTTSGNNYSFNDTIYGDLAADGFTLGTTFTIEVTITDALNGGKQWTTTLSSGTPAIAISGSNVAIGKQYDTNAGGKLQVDGNLEMKGAVRRTLAGSGSTIPETTILDVAGSTDGFQIKYKADTADVGITQLATQDDANAQLSLGNTVSGTYKEALRMENGEINVFNQRNLTVGCNGNNTNNYPWHRIATVTVGTGSWQDRDAILEIKSNFDATYYGLIKVSIRTNNASQSAACNGAVRWLVRSGYAAGDVVMGRWGASGQNVYADVFLKVPASYPRTLIRQYDPVKSWTLISSQEASDTTTTDKKGSVECYKDVATAATQLRGQAYTATHAGVDVATVNYSNSSGSATTWSGNTALTNDHATLNTGDTWIPVISSGKLQHTLRAIWSTQQHSNYNNNQQYLVTLSCLTYWNGAYNSSGSSNLTRAHQGVIQCKPTSLYDNSSGTSGSITLSQTAANFTYIDVFYSKNGSTAYHSVRIYTSHSMNDISCIMGYRMTDTSTQIGVSRIKISGTSLTHVSNGGVNLYNTANPETFTGNELVIKKVVGWKC